MEYKVATSLYYFPAWGGGKDTLEALKERDDWDEVEDHIENVFIDEDVTDEMINDYLWFERDAIAEALGYDDWEAYENSADPTADEEDESTDANGTPIKIGDTVVWDDEAGRDEDGTALKFKVVEDNGDGYYNIAYIEGEEYPERWSWCKELEVLE